jgi:hypothetical protein
MFSVLNNENQNTFAPNRKGEGLEKYKRALRQTTQRKPSPRERLSLSVTAYLDQTLEMALCPKFCATELCLISFLKQGPINFEVNFIQNYIHT